MTLVAERTARPSNSPISAASLSLSLPRLGWKSTSTPRSLKIWTAAGDKASEMSTRGAMVVARRLVVVFRGNRAAVVRRRLESRRLGQRILSLGERPVEPLGESLDVARFDRRAAPDAQARRSVAVVGDVVAGAFLLDRGREVLGEGRLRLDGKPGDRRIDDASGTPRCWSGSPAPWREIRPTASPPPSRRAP